MLADGRGMAPALPIVAIGGQARCWRFAKLTRHGRDHGGGRLGRVVEKGAEEARCPELDCKANPVVGAAHLPDQFAVPRKSSGFRCGVEVEVAGELFIVRIAGVAAVARTLVIGQETARHGVRNSGLLRQSGEGPKIRRLHAANIPRGTEQLCDRFRTAAEAVA